MSAASASYGELAMHLDPAVEADRAPHLPLLGFVLATGVSVYLWALIGSCVWALFA